MVAKTTFRGRKRSLRELQLDLVSQLEACEQRAHELGLYVAAGAINRAKNATGWEMLGDVEQAGRASRDEKGGAK